MAKKLNFTIADAHIKTTFNNTIVSFASVDNGNVFVSASAGTCGFKGAKKSTPYAAQETCLKAAQNAKAKGITKVHVKIQGTGSGREMAIRGISIAGLDILSIEDVTPVPHNGCRPQKHPRG